MTSLIKQGYITPDGTTFATAAEARDHLRKPLIEAALKKVAGGDPNLSKFLMEQEDEIQKAFEAGVVSRVTKSERKKLEKALEELATINNSKLKFLQDNAAAVLESFRWPSVKRLNEEQKAAATMEALTKLTDANGAAWIVKNKDAILEAYEAGIEKRVVNPKAMEALAAARDKRNAQLAAEKAAKENKPA
jgi:hypothetical protein